MSRSATPSSTASFITTLRRATAAATIVVLLVGTPSLAIRLLGADAWSWEHLRAAWSTGHLGDRALAQIGVALFLLLWAWFSITVVLEAASVIRWHRSGRVRRLPPIAPAPNAWVRRLVRAALISSTTLIGIAASSIGVASTAPARAAAMVAHHTNDLASARQHRDDVSGVTATPGTVSVVAGRRDTPYSIAARLGDATQRDRIIELNRGAIGPDGAAWLGGVFQPGMQVLVPATIEPDWAPYTVEPGDSVYGIAADLVVDESDDGGRIDLAELHDVATEILEHNLGRTMLDGDTFDDASLIRAGWVIEVPAELAPNEVEVVGAELASAELAGVELAGVELAGAEVHVVLPGESYWRITEDHLRAGGSIEPSPSEIADAVVALRDLNAPLLGHDDPNLLLPGETIRWLDDVEVVEVADVSAGPSIAIDPTPVAADVIVRPSSPTIDAAPAQLPPPTTAPIDVAPPAMSPANLPSTPAPVPDPAPATLPAAEPMGAIASSDEQSPLGWSIGATLLLSAGALGVLEARRREQLRRSGVRSLAPVPSTADAALERTLRSLDAPARAARIDVAIRAAATRLVPLGRHVIGLLVGHDGELVLLLDAVATPGAPWCAMVEGDRWLLPSSTPTSALADDARRSSGPCPALVHLGRTLGGSCPDHDLLIDLEAIGLLCLTGDARQNAPLLQSLIGTLVLSPLAETVRTVLARPERTDDQVDPTALVLPSLPDHMNVEEAESLDAALDVAAMHLGSTMTVTGARRTFALRAGGTDGRGEMWEPVIVVASLGDGPESSADDRDAAELAGSGGRGLGVVIDHLVPGAQWRTGPDLRTGDVGGAPTPWVLEPLGERFVPIGLAPEQVAQVSGLLERADRPVVQLVGDTDEAGKADVAGVAGVGPFVAPACDVMVRLLGGVEVCDPTGVAVPFARSKSLELIAWLATHRDRATRTGARTALWEVDVRAPTFANVVSEARRGMARAVPPPDGEEWIERTLNEDLPLHRGVRTDVELLTARVEAARSRSDAEAVAILRPGVALIRDLPFAGTSFLWPDAEGITSSCTLVATGAAIELAHRYLALGDVDGVFWASGQGLRVLPGHEELISLRMRAHATRGDLAGVRGEWEVYERALHADPWSTSEPSPKLVAVRRELLSH